MFRSSCDTTKIRSRASLASSHLLVTVPCLNWGQRSATGSQRSSHHSQTHTTEHEHAPLTGVMCMQKDAYHTTVVQQENRHTRDPQHTTSPPHPTCLFNTHPLQPTLNQPRTTPSTAGRRPSPPADCAASAAAAAVAIGTSAAAVAAAGAAAWPPSGTPAGRAC